MLREVFSDSFAQKENYLTAIDARVKLLFVAFALLLNLCLTKWSICLYTAAGCLWFLLSIKIPKRIILVRLCAPLGVTLMVMLIQIFFNGNAPIFQLRLFGFTLTGYAEGLSQAILIAGRVMAAVSLIIFLSMTTPLHKILAAARFFRVPALWVEITASTYRYIFMLFEDMVCIRDAQRMRLGYSTLSRSLRSMGELAGQSVIKAYDHSLAVQEAKAARCGKDKFYELYSDRKFKRNDWIAAGIFSAILLFLLTASVFM